MGEKELEKNVQLVCCFCTTPMSNTINRAVIRRLYRALLLEGRKWPHPPSRVQRSLHTHIPAIARNRFREAINEKDPAYIKALASEGALELFALQRLRNNEYFLKVIFTPYVAVCKLTCCMTWAVSNA